MNKKRMIVKTVKVENLSKAQIEEMWNLYSNSYDNVKKHEFETDLSEKTHVFIGLDKETKQFKGFSTFLSL
jgi:predicted transcriptional regulator